VWAPLRHADAIAFEVHAGSSMLIVPVGHARAIACDAHARQEHVGILSITCYIIVLSDVCAPPLRHSAAIAFGVHAWQ
jgi:hypothetical protein